MLDWNKKRLELMGMSRLIDGPTTVEELKDIVSDRWRLPGKPCDEVYSKIYIGGERAANDPALLKSLGITHIINAAGEDLPIRESFYITKGFRFTMKSFDAKDTHTFNIAQFFQEASRFIEVAIMHTGGKVLIHSQEGISRAATLAIAYLMIKREICGLEAVRTVRRKRHIKPNDGFLRQICELDERHRRERQY